MGIAAFASRLKYCVGIVSILSAIPPAGLRADAIPQMPWLHEGALLTTHFAVACAPGTNMAYTMSPDGQWIAGDGTRLDASERHGISGGGYTQYAITCVDKDKVYVNAMTFTDMRAFGFADPLAGAHATSLPIAAELSDMWISPAWLAASKSNPAENRVVEPVQWNVQGRRVDAVSITRLMKNGWDNHVYARSNGICLHCASSSTGAAPDLKYLAAGDVPAGDTLLCAVDFVNVRDVKVPWLNEPMPAWCNRFTLLHYNGWMGIPNSPLMGAPAPVGLDVTYKDSGPGWMAADTRGWMMVGGQQSPPVNMVIYSGRGQLDGFFAGPAALSRLQVGQVLDQDPVTNVTTSVTQMGGGTVTLTASSGGLLTTHTYDLQTGVLVATTKTDRQTHIVTQFNLQSRQ
jgi:hypothetical protein